VYFRSDYFRSFIVFFCSYLLYLNTTNNYKGKPHLSAQIITKEYKHPEFHQRLVKLIGREQPFSWAARIGISKGAFSRIWHEGTMPGTELLCKIQQSTGCSLDWLINGIGDATFSEKSNANELIEVPCINSEGQIMNTQDCCNNFRMSRRWLIEALEVTPENVFCFQINTQCMEPSFKLGDQVLVNSAVTFDTLKDGIYIIQIDGISSLKRIQRLPGNGFKLICDNTAFDNISVTKNEIDNLKLLGEAIWSGSKIG